MRVEGDKVGFVDLIEGDLGHHFKIKRVQGKKFGNTLVLNIEADIEGTSFEEFCSDVYEVDVTISVPDEELVEMTVEVEEEEEEESDDD